MVKVVCRACGAEMPDFKIKTPADIPRFYAAYIKWGNEHKCNILGKT